MSEQFRSFPHSSTPHKPFRRILECRLSSCLRYRYLLQVALSPNWDNSPTLTIILKNPSTANAQRGDPTTGKVEAWARHHGYAVITYLNLFALRSPYPKTINSVDYNEVVGTANDQTIQDELYSAHTLVIAWGNPNGIDAARYQRRINEVTLLLKRSQNIVHVVGPFTLLGHPRHGFQWRKELAIRRLGDSEIGRLFSQHIQSLNL